MTVSDSSWECQCGAIRYPPGTIRRTTNAPDLPGSPCSTDSCAPGGRDGGAGPHLKSLGPMNAALSAEVAAVASAAQNAKSASALHRGVAIAVPPLPPLQEVRA